MWMRYAGLAAPIVLVVALTAAIVLTSDAGPQPTTAATVARQAGGDLGASPPPAAPQTTPAPPCENGTVVPSPADNPGLVADCALLLGAKDTLRGTEPLNWSADTAIASWHGITVGGSPSRVTRLVLDRNTSAPLYGRRITLRGTIPAALGGLSKLDRLTLARHELTGTIPVELANLSELTDLQLHGNDLTGGIPPELGNLSNLGRLGLSGNPLSGAIPVELGKLSNLRALSLENTQLTGSIPASLGDLPNLSQLSLYGNTMLTGCIPASLRGISLNDLHSLGLEYCTTTTTHALTTSAEGTGRISPLPGTYSYLEGANVTVTATPDGGNRIASWGGDCSGMATSCTLTMDDDRTASVTFERITHTLTVTAGEGGSVTPGTSTHDEDAEVTLTASWNGATHSFTGWGGDCSGTTSTCVLTMDAAKTVTATFAALAADRCATATAADCIRAVYLGAPGDYAQVADIPADTLLTPDADGRYQVERGQQVTVVTAAPLPAGWTRFWLARTPLTTDPSPLSHEQLVPPVGTTYTFTVTEDEAASTLITFDLKQARPFVRPRPDGKPEIGATVVTTVFSVETSSPRYSSYDTTGAVATAGSYAFLSDPADTTTAATTYEALRDGTTTALLIHQSDAHGASQAALYDAVETGDLIEWREADDCFVRYRVADAPEPGATAVKREFGVRWETYAFQGCQTGSLTASGLMVTFMAADELPLEHLGGTNLADFAVVHGAWQLVPEGWTGATEEPTSHDPPAQSGERETTAIVVARTFPYWREPTLPAGWGLNFASTGAFDGPAYGYGASFGPRGGVTIGGYYATGRRYARESSFGSGAGAFELLVIAGRPAMIVYSPPGPNHAPKFSEELWIYDAATESEYVIFTDHLPFGKDDVIAIARSLFESPSLR